MRQSWAQRPWLEGFLPWGGAVLLCTPLSLYCRVLQYVSMSLFTCYYCLYAQGLLLVGIESWSASCKTSALPSTLSLQPHASFLHFGHSQQYLRIPPQNFSRGSLPSSAKIGSFHQVPGRKETQPLSLHLPFLSSLCHRPTPPCHLPVTQPLLSQRASNIGYKKRKPTQMVLY